MRHLARVALLDRYRAAILDVPVDRRRRQRDIEWDGVIRGRERLQIGADLVRDIARRARAVGAGDAEIDLAVAHQMAAGIIGDHRVGDAVLAEFPGGQAGALVARPRLVDPHMHRDPRIISAVDRRQGGAPIDRREPAGVAVGQDLHRAAPALSPMRVFDQPEPVLADRAVDRDILFGDFPRPCDRGGKALFRRQLAEMAAHPVERPAQIDRRGARRGEAFDRAVEPLLRRVLGHRQGDPIRRCRADQRRPAHLHVADGARRIGGAREPENDKLMRQPGLIDDLDGSPILGEPNRTHRAAGYLHRGLISSEPARRPRRVARRAPDRGGRRR